MAVDAAIFADNAAFVAGKVKSKFEAFLEKKDLSQEPPLPKLHDPLQLIPDHDGPFQRRLRKVSPPLIEMLLIRIVDIFTTYLSDVLGECLKARPELLRSNEALPTEVVLQFDSIDDLRSYIAEKKINQLSYLSFSNVLEWIASRLGISSLSELDCFQSLVEIVEIRNCLVHNKGRVSAKYVKAISTWDNSVCVNDELTVNMDTLSIAIEATSEFVTTIDGLLQEKFALPMITP